MESLGTAIVFLGCVFLLISIWLDGMASDTLVRAGREVDCSVFYWTRINFNLFEKLGDGLMSRIFMNIETGLLELSCVVM